MCLGAITTLLETWDEGGTRVGRLGDGSVVSLAFVPDALPGAQVLVHLGVPVEVLDAEVAADALALRAPAHIDEGEPR